MSIETFDIVPSSPNPFSLTVAFICSELSILPKRSEDPKKLKLARKQFMANHKTVFKVLGAMQSAYYRSDDRRERFVSLCKDKDVQKLTFEAYMNKKLMRTKFLAHVKIMLKNLAHLTGVIKATS